MSQLPVSEMFYSLQGEGPYAGHPAIFLRLAGCNLSCGWDGDLRDFDPETAEPQGDAEWVCDTIDVWRDPDSMYDPEELVLEWSQKGWLEKIETKDAHVVLTGGEPTLQSQQERFSELYHYLKDSGFEPFVEVETNGTQLVQPEFRSVVDQFNVSLKLSNSGHDEEERIKEHALRQYVGWEQADFKFVVADERDHEEVQELIDEYEIDRRQVMLMPAGYSQESLQDTYGMVAELCKEYGYRFSPRMHVEIWNQATGV